MNTENNKLIAEFMGWESNIYPHLPNRVHKLNPVNHSEMSMDIGVIKYHVSWDWLMPVVEKISKIKGFNDIENDLSDLRITAKMENVYSAVISFIKWHNTQNQ